MLLLAAVNFNNPLLWAVLVGWVLSVTLHELGHGIAAHLGGDYTIRERGGLTLNPLQYIDPFMSIILPIIFLLMGGIPLPGGATFIRTDLLRNRAWITITYAAGPLMNVILFLVAVTLLHPRLGWVNHDLPVPDWTNAQIFVGAMAVLQFWSVLANLVPIPPVDGFGIISPYVPNELRERVTTPPWNTICLFGYFMVMMTPGVGRMFVGALIATLSALGYAPDAQANVWYAFRQALYGDA